MAAEFELSFAGLPFREPTPVVRELVERQAQLENILPVPDQREWKDILPQVPTPPPARIGELFYPWGARRWATFRGLMHKDDVATLLPLISNFRTFGYEPLPQAFVMHTGDPAKQVATQLYCLPPQPLVGVNDAADLFLVTLVDERFYWRWTAVTLKSELPTGGDPRGYEPSGQSGYKWQHTWDTIFTQIGVAIGTIAGPVVITTGVIEPEYGYPDASSPFNGFNQPAPAVLDAAAAHTGRVIVRKFDGTYEAVPYRTANQAAETFRNGAPRAVGGLPWTDAEAHAVAAANSSKVIGASRPRFVRVTYGTWDTKAGTHKIRDLNIPQDDRTDFKDADSQSVDGNGFWKGFLDFREAQIRQGGTRTPTTTANRLAKDWYDWQARDLSESYDGVYAVEPRAALDATYDYFGTRTHARFQGLGYEWRYFWHSDGVTVNEWPRQAIVKVESVDLSNGVGQGYILYPTDPGNAVGTEWPRITIGSYASSIVGHSAKWMALQVGMVLPATFVGGLDPDPAGSAPSAVYLSDGIFQGAAGPPSGPLAYLPTPMGSVWAGDQHLGTGVKTVGALNINRSPDLVDPDWFSAGLISMGYFRNSYGALAGNGAALVAVGQFWNSDISGNGAGGNTGSGGFPVSGMVMASHTLAVTGGGVNGTLGWSTGISSAGGVMNGLIQSGWGGPATNSGLTGHGQGADAPFVWTPQGGSLPRGVSPSLSENTPWIPDGQYMPKVANLLHPQGIEGLGIAGYLSVGGGIRCPLTGFSTHYTSNSGPLVPGGTANAWAEGQTAYVPHVPIRQGGFVPFTQCGAVGQNPCLPGQQPIVYTYQAGIGYQERWGYPPDPAGPMMYVGGLYVGGGGNLATIDDVERLIGQQGGSSGGGTTSISTLTGGGIVLDANDGGVDERVAPGTYVRMKYVSL